MRYIGSDFLCEYRLLYSEMTFEDELGRPCDCDIVLQRLPEGEAFDPKTSTYDSRRLGAMLDALKAEFGRIGFTHNNLKPSNLIIGDDGRLHPIRYHYAEIGSSCRDDFAPLYELVGSGENPVVGDVGRFTGTTGNDGRNPLRHARGFAAHLPRRRYGIRRRIGQYRDSDTLPLGRTISSEGRAVVETENGLGLIDKSGREVIAAIYDDVCYDPIGGESEVRLDGLSAVFSYDGRQLDEFSKEGL